MIQNFLVLGAGSAGLLAALTIRRQMPQATVRVVRSPELGTIGVGESTTPNVPRFLFDYLGIDRRQFYQMAEPTWKLGIHFLWGPRASYEYPFLIQLDARVSALPRPNGFYCDDDFSNVNIGSALMSQGRAFVRQPDGSPEFTNAFAFHLENAKFVKTLEIAARQFGIEFIDGTIKSAEKGPQGISSVMLEDGQTLAADFFIDASGFHRTLLGKTLEEPFISYSQSLLNDRAILGTWERGDEPILPYTTAETMNSGWSWRIDHEQSINRGYVFSSAHISEDDARKEFADKNPKAKVSDRVIRFKTGRFERAWVGNVMAIGNASGFVEPLEATSLMIICWQCQTFADLFNHVGPVDHVRSLFNRVCANVWDETRDFLSLHFKTNTRLDTPYWQTCQRDTDVSRIQSLLDFYEDAGPTGFGRYHTNNPESQFGIEGYLVQLVGNKVPYRNRHTPAAAELQFFNQMRTGHRASAAAGLTVRQTLDMIRHPNWRWFYERKS